MDDDEFLGTLALLREQMQRDQTALKTSENVVQTISPRDLQLLQKELSHLKTAAREREQLLEASKQRVRSLESDAHVQGGSTEQLRAEATRLQTKVLTQAAACDAAEAAKVASEARVAALEERLSVAQVKGALLARARLGMGGGGGGGIIERWFTSPRVRPTQNNEL
jgi:chromosome segregation ATPase